MSESPLDRIQDLFDRAVALPENQRGPFLDRACAGDVGLRAGVEALLRADESLGPEDVAGLLPPPVLRRTGPPTGAFGGAPVTHPERIGPYRIVRFVAAGGMGVVYEAEQDNPCRRVALKIVHPGVTSPAVLQRCRDEAQILGRLHHPGIPQVYAAGVVPDGRPYFAMEFVPGLHLDEYARRGALSVRDRIELTARVCDAVHHAHEQGIVHRDLKPANVLVDETGQPKVLDFGVARVAIADRLTGAAVTRTGQFIGTLNYMSPEQLSGPSVVVDRRADVYSLGVILFELLTGRPPSLLEAYSIGEASRVLRDVDAPRLGTMYPILRGDVETIVAQSLEKDPPRRYPTAAEFAADLRRYLANEPIAVRPPTALYQLRKFVRRNRALVGGAAATGLALVLGLVGTLVFAVGESRQRTAAEAHAREALAAKGESEHQAYHARIAAATAALSSHDVEGAGRQLAAAPEHLRGWEWRHLSARLDDSIATHPLSPSIGAFLTGAPDRLRYGTINDEGVRLTNFEGGTDFVVPVRSATRKHVAAAQTPLGLRVAMWTGPTTIHVFDESGRIVCRAEVPNAKQAEPIVLSPDGKQLATQLREGEWQRLLVFDATSGKQSAVCAGHRDGIWSTTFSRDATRFASAGDDHRVRVWDATSGAQVSDCLGHGGRVLSVAFHPDGDRLVTGSSDGTVRQWETATGRETEAPYDRHTGEVAAVEYSPDGLRVASAGTNRTIRVWQAKGREDVAVRYGHTGSVVRVAHSPDGKRLASLSLTWIFSQGEDAVRLWDVAEQRIRPVLRGHTQPVYPVAFSPGGRQLASGSWDGTVRLWDVSAGESPVTLPHPGVVSALAYGPDGTWLLTGNYGDDRVRVWDVATGRVRKHLQGPPGVFRFVTVSPDGARLAATVYGGEKHTFEVCELESEKRLYSTDGKALAYSPDGRLLAVVAADEQTVLLLDARTHETITRLGGHEKGVHAAVFSPDGRRLATCGMDRTVRVWPVDGGECKVLRGHTDDVFAAAFHPDGTRLATAGRDRAIRLWDLTRGEDVARLQGHASYVWSLAFNPDGTTLASGSGDSTVRLWDTVPLRIRHGRRGN